MEQLPGPRLVEQARSGCRLALSQLFECRYAQMLSIARGILRNDDDAQDATQEAALHIIQNLQKLEDAEAYGAWSHKILLRCCFRLLRRKERYRFGHFEIDDEGWRLADRDPGPQQLEAQIRVGEISDQLGHRMVEIVRLRLHAGLSVKETAATLGISEGAVKLRLHRARQKARASCMKARRESAAHAQTSFVVRLKFESWRRR